MDYESENKPAKGDNRTVNGNVGETLTALDDLVERNAHIRQQLEAKLRVVLQDPETVTGRPAAPEPPRSVLDERLHRIATAVAASNDDLAYLLDRLDI